METKFNLGKIATELGITTFRNQRRNLEGQFQPVVLYLAFFEGYLTGDYSNIPQENGVVTWNELYLQRFGEDWTFEDREPKLRTRRVEITRFEMIVDRYLNYQGVEVDKLVSTRVSVEEKRKIVKAIRDAVEFGIYAK